MKLLIYFVINLVYVEANMSLFNPSTIESKALDQLTHCIIITNEDEETFKPTVVIDTQNVKDKSKEYLDINKMICQLQDQEIPIVMIDNEKHNYLYEKILIMEDKDLNKTYPLPALIVIFFETCEDVISLQLTDINKADKYLIAIINPTNDYCIDGLEALKYHVYKYDVTFIFLNNPSVENKMITFIPKVDAILCTEVVNEPTYINTNNEVLQRKDIFPSKSPTNLNKCPFRAGMAVLYPFSDIKDRGKLKNYETINKSEGSDTIIMQDVANFFNATLELHYIHRQEGNPYAKHEFIKYLLNESLDACGGGLYRVFGDVVEYSGTYASQAIFWLYYVERVERSWENLIIKINGLYVFVIIYISYSFIWYIVWSFDGDAVSFKETLLYGWGALVGAASLQSARSIKQRILNLGYLIMCIHLYAYINIQLYSFLTIREPPELLDTNDAIMTSGRTPYLIRLAKYFVSDKRYHEFANTSKDCLAFDDCADSAIENHGMTIVLHGDFFGIQARTTIDGEARVLRTSENVLTVYNDMIVRKSSALAEKFKEIIQSLFEAGIVKKLFNEAIGTLTIDKANIANRNMLTNSYSCTTGCSIAFLQCAGMFYAWISGCVLSCVVFIIELCIKREKQ